MPEKIELAVIGHYPSSGEANLACNKLRDAGIPADVADDVTADMDWGLIVAINNVKVLVPADRVEEAQSVLADRVALAEVDNAARQTIAEPETDEAPEELSSPREKNAQRAYVGAIASMVFWPLQFYIFWVLIKVYVSNEPLGPRYRRRAWVAAAFNVPMVLIQCLLLRILFRAFLDSFD